jgi:hypothetical protein
MADRGQRFALLSRYDQHYKFRYNVVPQYNKWSEQWAADALIESYGKDLCYELLQYYFDVAANPDWKYFSNNIDKIIDGKQDYEKDIEERAERRKMAKAWLNE